MSNTPFELRFQIFEAAKQSLVDEYWAQDSLRRLMLDGLEPVDSKLIPDHPEYPTMKSIMERAKNINEFVSNS
jgi:hypothetical protein